MSGSCCRMYTKDGCDPSGGGVATVWRNSASFTADWGSSINDKIASYHCILATTQSTNPYCMVNGSKRDVAGEE